MTRKTHTSAMEPMLPETTGLDAMALELHKNSSALAARLHPVTGAALADLVRAMNAYHSNLIEGVHTTPADLERALLLDYSRDEENARKQRLAVAHIRVDEMLSKEMRDNPKMDILSPDFLRRVHKEIYAGAAPRDLTVSYTVEQGLDNEGKHGRQIVPGELRDQDVRIGNRHDAHVPPEAESIPEFLKRFATTYSPDTLPPGPGQVMAFAASHHRLAWIHPFLDGNGRVARLFSSAYARRIGIDGGGLWSISRGFARNKEAYYSALRGADALRQYPTDGRGPLSLKSLTEWCEFAIKVSLDQVAYMDRLLEPDTLAERVVAYAAFMRASNPNARAAEAWRPEAGRLLADVVRRGSVKRGEALDYFPRGERMARSALSVLLKDGILTSNSHKGDVRVAFPLHASQILFKNLMIAPNESQEYRHAAGPETEHTDNQQVSKTKKGLSR